MIKVNLIPNINKVKQGYNPKPTLRICCNCKHYSADKGGVSFKEADINKMCTLGGFKVTKNGTCDKFNY